MHSAKRTSVYLSTLVVLGMIALGIGIGAYVGNTYSKTAPEEIPLLQPAIVSEAPSIPQPEPVAVKAAPPHFFTIPALGIRTAVELVGLDAKRRMDVPQDPDQVAWYMHGPPPGEEGNAVIAGHLDSTTGPAVFYNLEQLTPGDEILVTDAEGKERRFHVYDKATYSVADFPLDQVFGPTDEKQLNLITCEGSFNQNTKQYSHRVVVYTKLVE
ncbi:MAG: class F sortase [Acidobacteriota bacterium]